MTARRIATDDKTYVHTQGVAASMWTVNHNLGKYPSVTVVDSVGREVEGDVQHTSTSQTILSFAGAFSGSAYFN